MWLIAASAVPSEALIYAVGTLLGVVVTTVGLILVQAMKSRADRTTASPPSPVADTRLAERVAVLEHRADDSDTRDDMQDRAIDTLLDRAEAIEAHLDRTDPGWR